MAATYNVTVKCMNCFWRGTIALNKGSDVAITGSGYIQGQPCTNCGCERLVKDDR